MRRICSRASHLDWRISRPAEMRVLSLQASGMQANRAGLVKVERELRAKRPIQSRQSLVLRRRSPCRLDSGINGRQQWAMGTARTTISTTAPRRLLDALPLSFEGRTRRVFAVKQEHRARGVHRERPRREVQAPSPQVANALMRSIALPCHLGRHTHLSALLGRTATNVQHFRLFSILANRA